MIGLYRLGKMLWDARGVEGLPLKYVIIILVAALVIGIAVTMTNQLTGTVTNSTSLISNATINAINNSTAGLPG